MEYPSIPENPTRPKNRRPWVPGALKQKKEESRLIPVNGRLPGRNGAFVSRDGPRWR